MLSVCLASCTGSGNTSDEDAKKIQAEFPYVGTDLVMYDRRSGGEIGAVLKIVTERKDPDIKVIGISGKNISGIVCTLEDTTFKSLDGKRINSLYIKQIGISIPTMSEYTEIDSITLSVNGVTEEYKFKYPLIHRTPDDRAGGDLYFASCPSLVQGTALKKGDTLNYNFFTDQKAVTLEKAAFGNFLELKECTVILNDKDLGAIEDVLPLEIPAGSKLVLKTKIDYRKEYGVCYYENVYCDLLVAYRQDGTEHELVLPIIVQGISNEDTGIGFLKSFEKKK